MVVVARIIGALFLGVLGAGLVLAAAPEYEVKAAFLYNFAKFVEWPPDALSTTGTMNVCVLGEDPFGPALERAVEGKRVHERPIHVTGVVDVTEVSRCHILFISSSERRELSRLLPAIAGLSVLTVGEMASFAQAGGMIGFTAGDNRVRFEINNEAASRAGLQISSQLLKLATRVIQ